MVSHIPHSFTSEGTGSTKICAGETAHREEKSLLNQQISPFLTTSTHSKGLSSQRRQAQAKVSGWRSNHHTGSIPILPSSPGSCSESLSEAYTGYGLLPGDEELTAPFTPGLFHPFPAQTLIRNSTKSVHLAFPGEGNLPPSAHPSPCPQTSAPTAGTRSSLGCSSQEQHGNFFPESPGSSFFFSQGAQLGMPQLQGKGTQPFATLASPLPQLCWSLSASGV